MAGDYVSLHSTVLFPQTPTSPMDRIKVMVSPLSSEEDILLGAGYLTVIVL